MKKIAPVCRITMTFISIFVFNLCISSSAFAQKVSVASGDIPPDMAKETFTIIGVLKDRKSYDKYLEKGFAEYTGNYVLATKEEIASKYKDVEKYRYLLDYDEGTTDYSTPGNRNVMHHKIFFIIDRKDGKKYVRKSFSSFFAKELRNHINAIESARKK